MAANEQKAIIWYFADPMCSWCWGFSPVIKQIKETFADQVTIALNLGGLRPGTQDAISDEQRDEILHHWRSVEKMTGQPFKFENAMPEGFVYDTEPASRVIALITSLDAELTFPCLYEIQAAFYRDGRDVTDTNVLKEIVVKLGVGEEQFDALFESANIKQATQQHFKSSHQAGIRGFPALIWQKGDHLALMSSGYQSFETLSDKINSNLTNQPEVT